MSTNTESPVFVRGLDSQSVLVGHTVEFAVSVSANPPASLIWLINGFVLSGRLCGGVTELSACRFILRNDYVFTVWRGSFLMLYL